MIDEGKAVTMFRESFQSEITPAGIVYKATLKIEH